MAQEGEASCYGCFITLMEVLYRVWRDEGEAAGRTAYQQCLALPISWVSNSDTLLLKAAQYKALFPLSMADAWIAASASETDAVLLHKDPEFKPLRLKQELLPLKPKNTR